MSKTIWVILKKTKTQKLQKFHSYLTFKLIIISPRHIVLNDHLSREPPPPQKKKRPFFWGGMFFWDKFVNFCPFCIKKILERLGDWLNLTATYRPIPGRFQSRIKIWNFKNMRFLLFLSKFLTFFFQMSECWSK